MRRSSIFFYLFVQTILLQAQPRSVTFYQDTISIKAIIVWFNKADSIVFRLPEEKSFQFFKPSDIDSVFIGSKGMYLPKTIILDGKSVQKFLHRTYNGVEWDLYELENSNDFFLEKNQQLSPVSKEKSARSDILSEISQSCILINRRVNQIYSNKKSLSFFVQDLEDCQYRLLPHPRFGLTVGTTFWHASSFLLNRGEVYQKTVDISYGSNYLVGLFGEIPILWSRHLYFRGELLFSNQDLRLYRKGNLENYNLLIDFSRLEVPVQLSYVATIARVHPYMSLGINYLYYFSASAEEAKAWQDVNGWTWQIGSPFLVSKSQIGYTIGAGVMIPLNARNMLSLQGRFNQASSFINANDAPVSNFFTLSTSINW